MTEKVAKGSFIKRVRDGESLIKTLCVKGVPEAARGKSICCDRSVKLALIKGTIFASGINGQLGWNRGSKPLVPGFLARDVGFFIF